MTMNTNFGRMLRPENSSPQSKLIGIACRSTLLGLLTDYSDIRYPWFLEDWDQYEFPIQRADAIRYFVLSHYGGIYIDLDDVSDDGLRYSLWRFQVSLKL